MSTLYITNGKLIDGSSIEILVKDGKIIDFGEKLEMAGLKPDVTLNLYGKFISAGWIDDHVHCYEKMNLYYDFPDTIGIARGVTTVIDAGTSGINNIDDFYSLAKNCKTNVLAMVNISEWGIVEQNELEDLTKIKPEKVKEKIAEMPQFIVGIKARMSKTVVGPNGVTPLKLAKQIQKENDNIPLMVHIGSNPPKLEEVFELLEAGDIVTHCFNGKPNGIVDQETGKIKDFAMAAHKRGVVFDIGHGTDSFNFNTGKTAFDSQLIADSISSDIYIRNRTNGPVYDLATTMDKLHYVGYSWEDIIDKVTVQPAKNFRLANKGKIEKGYDADFTVFEISHEAKTLIDSNHNEKTTHESLVPKMAIVNGVIY